MSADEQACLAQLEFAEERGTLPRDCDTDALVREGLIAPGESGWVLTDLGRLRLQNLRSVCQSRYGAAS